MSLLPFTTGDTVLHGGFHRELTHGNSIPHLEYLYTTFAFFEPFASYPSASFCT